MPSSISTNDILWTRTGDPVRVDKVNEQTGKVNLDRDFATIQETTKNGVKNGLSVPEREAYKSTLSGVQNPDKKEEIRELYQKIKSLKQGNTEPRLLKYLESELQFRIIRENYEPNDYEVNPVTLDI